MWYKLFVCLVAATWITAIASPLKTAEEASQNELPILIPDLSNVDSYALKRIKADKFLTLWHINVLSGSVHISDEPWTLLIPHNTGLPKNPNFIVDTEYTRQILLNHVIIGDIVEPKVASTDAKLSFYSLSDTELKFSSKGDETYVNGVRLTGDMLKYKNGIIYVIEKTIEVSQPDYLKFVPELKYNIFNSLGFDTNKSEKYTPVTKGTVQQSNSSNKKENVESPKSEGTRMTRFEKFRNIKMEGKLKSEENSGKELSAKPSNDHVEQLDPLTEYVAKSGFPKTNGETRLAEFKAVPPQNETFLESLEAESKVENSLAREFFYHFMDTNLNKILLNDQDYTALIATDDAFYDYYPIDWGFNPFLVENFTKDVLLNHIIPANINFYEEQNGRQFQTLGGRMIQITKKEGNKIEVNGEPIPTEFDIEVHRGRIYYVDKLLFVDINRVNDLRDEYPYLESGPLISFPWPSSPFLSHLAKRLQESTKYTIFRNFLLKSSISHQLPISDADLERKTYSAFVPTDDVMKKIFTKEQLDQLQSQSSTPKSSSSLSVEEINNFLVNHLFYGYIMQKDFNNTGSLLNLAEKNVDYVKLNDYIKVGEAFVVGKQQYLYNLGAIYYINNTITSSKQFNKETNVEKVTDEIKTTHLFLNSDTGSVKQQGISVPFPKNPSSGVQFPSVNDPNYRFETRTEVSFSRQVNNGDIIPVTKEEVERAKRRTA